MSKIIISRILLVVFAVVITAIYFNGVSRSHNTVATLAKRVTPIPTPTPNGSRPQNLSASYICAKDNIALDFSWDNDPKADGYGLSYSKSSATINTYKTMSGSMSGLKSDGKIHIIQYIPFSRKVIIFWKVLVRFNHVLLSTDSQKLIVDCMQK